MRLVPVMELVPVLGYPSHLASAEWDQKDGAGVSNGAGTGYRALVPPGHCGMGTTPAGWDTHPAWPPQDGGSGMGMVLAVGDLTCLATVE